MRYRKGLFRDAPSTPCGDKMTSSLGSEPTKCCKGAPASVSFYKARPREPVTTRDPTHPPSHFSRSSTRPSHPAILPPTPPIRAITSKCLDSRCPPTRFESRSKPSFVSTITPFHPQILQTDSHLSSTRPSLITSFWSDALQADLHRVHAVLAPASIKLSHCLYGPHAPDTRRRPPFSRHIKNGIAGAPPLANPALPAHPVTLSHLDGINKKAATILG
ncbi:hypothetical protein B0J18DRAFT_297888 [Chaetomium sp. MPI-SDFR-AT-0129]|nr:hypothetical protein B0J18DRAFT_297888 [Chaetomium sp. MPI-SDFR-AT-0129]